MFLQEFWLSPCVGTAVMHLLLIAASCVFFQILLSQGQFLQWIPQVKTLFSMWTLLEYNPAALLTQTLIAVVSLQEQSTRTSRCTSADRSPASVSGCWAGMRLGSL